ncbi:hypothetical protein FGO68_gene14539 [Halteria grandinella]|uniref:RING-type domain-containing protein n=1 Tax=Halteria grandinella TaxID=5974 RepID=A0A8J8T7P2_HALGN|nr:hypothetical protein FGO68_gene14539 [Halteria grandinella]
MQDEKPIETAMLSLTERKNKLRSKDLKKLSSSQITQATLETDFKLCKMIEVAQNDKELIEIQRKAIYMQRLEFHSLSLNHEALQRNFEALSNQVLVERQEKAELQLKINQLANERLSINDRIKELQDKLGAVGLGDREYDMRKENEIKELRENLELRRQQIEQLKSDLQKRIKKINEIESKNEIIIQGKDKEISTLTADLRANNDLMKETMAQYRAKQQTLQLAQGKIIDLESKLKQKTEADMTMKEVIERVRIELNQQYVPLISQLKEEAHARNSFYQREMEKMENAFGERTQALEDRVRAQDLQLQDWIAKYNDKCKECASYISISEHRLQQYNELLSKKKELEDSKGEHIQNLESELHKKDEETLQLKSELFQLEQGIGEDKREEIRELGHFKERVILLEQQLMLSVEKCDMLQAQMVSIQNDRDEAVANAKKLVQKLEETDRFKQHIEDRNEEKYLEMRREIADRCNQVMSLQLEIQRLTNEKLIDKQVIDELERRIDYDRDKLYKLQKEDSELFTTFKTQTTEELTNLKRSFEKIGKDLMCKSCWKLGTDCLMLKCGHSLCSTCSLKGVGDVFYCKECMEETEISTISRSQPIKQISLNYIMSKKILESVLSLVST